MMHLQFRVIQGPLKGESFPIKEERVIGRKKSDIALQDPKASNFHALITKNSLGQYELIDQNSRNGTKLNGERLDVITLATGMVIQIGDSFLLVEPSPNESAEIKRDRPFAAEPIAHDSKNSDDFDTAVVFSNIPKAEMPTPKETPPVFDTSSKTFKMEAISGKTQDQFNKLHRQFKKFVEKLPSDEKDNPENVADPNINESDLQIEPNHLQTGSRDLQSADKNDQSSNQKSLSEPEPFWADLLEVFLDETLDQISNEKKVLSPLSPPILLNFIRGPQANTKWTIGYGPRKVGRASFDLPLFEPNAPDLCFELTPSIKGILFSTKHDKLVLLNGHPTKSAVLNHGDKITIGSTLIGVEHLDESR